VRPPDSWKNARVTLAIAGVTSFVWLLTSFFGVVEPAVLWGGFVPARAGQAAQSAFAAPFFLTPLTYALIHGGWFHVGINLLMLLFCGRSVEGIVGGVGMILLYILGALAAAAAYYLVDSDGVLPMFGASGAMSAVLGAFAMLFGRNKVRVASPRLALALHALWLMAAWIGLQFLLAIITRNLGAPLAVAGHIAGFLVGVLLTRPLLLLR
jgi:membrane associated rhomboid family serine protease